MRTDRNRVWVVCLVRVRDLIILGFSLKSSVEVDSSVCVFFLSRNWSLANKQNFKRATTFSNINQFYQFVSTIQSRHFNLEKSFTENHENIECKCFDSDKVRNLFVMQSNLMIRDFGQSLAVWFLHCCNLVILAGLFPKSIIGFPKSVSVNNIQINQYCLMHKGNIGTVQLFSLFNYLHWITLDSNTHDHRTKLCAMNIWKSTCSNNVETGISLYQSKLTLKCDERETERGRGDWETEKNIIKATIIYNRSIA